MQPEITPTYILHPSNYDRGEEFAMLFMGPPEGEGFGQNADAYFREDANKAARLMVWMTYDGWLREFIKSLSDAREDLLENFEDYESLEDFLGEGIERADLETHHVKILRAS